MHFATSTIARRAVVLVPLTAVAMVTFFTGIRTGVVVETLEFGFGTPGWPSMATVNWPVRPAGTAVVEVTTTLKFVVLTTPVPRTSSWMG